MADSKKNDSPQGEVELKGADAVAQDAAVSAEEDRIKVLEEVGKVLRENAVGDERQPSAGAEAFSEAAKKQAKDVKYSEDGHPIGVDGVNLVSNENPDPRTVR